MFALFPSADFSTVAWVVGLIAACGFSISGYLAARIVETCAGKDAAGFAAFGVAAILTSPLILTQVNTLMEAPWVILAGALAYHCVLAEKHWPLWAVAGVGAFGSLARTDFGLLPAVLLLCSLIVPLDPSVRRRIRTRLVALLVGASLALGLFLLYVHDYSGHWLQSSARMKSLWGDTADTALSNYFLLLMVVALPRAGVLFAGGAAIQLIAGLAMRLRTARSSESQPVNDGLANDADSANRTQVPRAFVAISGAATTLAYVLFFGQQNLAPQTWYASAFAFSLALSIGVTFGIVLGTVKVHRAWQMLFVTVVVLGVASSHFEGRYARFPHQANMLGAAMWLKEYPLDKPVAAFNAGILSYFSEKDVINLDGLVNDDIFDYAKRDALSEYFDARDIGYLLDYPGMWTQPSFQQRGGFSNGDLNRRLQPALRIPPLVPKAPWLRGYPTLMKVMP